MGACEVMSKCAKRSACKERLRGVRYDGIDFRWRPGTDSLGFVPEIILAMRCQAQCGRMDWVAERVWNGFLTCNTPPPATHPWVLLHNITAAFRVLR